MRSNVAVAAAVVLTVACVVCATVLAALGRLSAEWVAVALSLAGGAVAGGALQGKRKARKKT